MIDERDVRAHYATARLLAAIREGLARMGKSEADVGVDDLAPVDEFHIGGRQASADFHAQLGWNRGEHLLDVGCGLGGVARYVASHYGVRVTGVDLSPEFVATGQALNRWVGLDDRVTLTTASALRMPFPVERFDGGYLMHVGMNVADKTALFAEVARVLRPGAAFGVYDVMQVGHGEVDFPVPWASTPDTSRLESPERYAEALEAAGFDVERSRDRREFAIAFFDDLRDKLAAAGGPPPLALHLVMGDAAPVKIRNMVGAIKAGRIAPVEMIARLRR